MDGSGAIRFFIDMLLPLSRTNMLALTTIMFVYGWNQYLWPLLMVTDPQYKTTMMSLYLVGGSVGFALGPKIVQRVADMDLHATPWLMLSGLVMAGALAAFAPRDWSPSGIHGERPPLWRVLYDHRRVLGLLLTVVVLRSWTQLGFSTFLPFY